MNDSPRDEQHDSSSRQLPPSDVERTRVLARLIDARIAALHTARAAGSFTPGDARELYVLEAIRHEWLLEGTR